MHIILRAMAELFIFVGFSRSSLTLTQRQIMRSVDGNRVQILIRKLLQLLERRQRRSDDLSLPLLLLERAGQLAGLLSDTAEGIAQHQGLFNCRSGWQRTVPLPRLSIERLRRCRDLVVSSWRFACEGQLAI